MALKFLNKKGWHTGSLRNIENVWKAEQKHEAEEKKLDELRKQIQEERERSEFRQLQEQAGLVPRQERLEFLYDGGLSVGKGNTTTSSGTGVAFKELEPALAGGAKTSESAAPSSSSSAAAPGALFEDKPQSANDAWRKLHSDPLLMIRQREQEALARIKNNPVQMALIRKSVQGDGEKEKGSDRKEHKKKQRHGDSKHSKLSSSNQLSDAEDDGRNGDRKRSSNKHKSSKYHDHPASDAEEDDGKNGDRKRSSNKHRSSKYHDHPASDAEEDDGRNGDRKRSFNKHKSSKYRDHSASEDESSGRESRRRKDTSRGLRDRDRSPPGRFSEKTDATHRDRWERDHERSKTDKRFSDGRETRPNGTSVGAVNQDSYRKRRNSAPKLSEEERAARLKEMQLDAEIHEEQRWKRLKKADEADVQEDSQAKQSGGKNFLDAAQKSIYGAEKGGSSTIEESVRRRAYYSQRSESGGNAFRR
ncbi:Pre-mRNA-splicing factor CWC25 homolog [Linum perenne]